MELASRVYWPLCKMMLATSTDALGKPGEMLRIHDDFLSVVTRKDVKQHWLAVGSNNILSPQRASRKNRRLQARATQTSAHSVKM